MSVAPVELAMIASGLRTDGWCFIPRGLTNPPTGVLSALGSLVSSPEGALHVDLIPRAKASAPHASMSARTGPDEQPMHTDAAYDPCPPRYIAFQCLEPGEVSCPTHVWALNLALISKERPAVLTNINWISHGGGRPPFYCPVMDVLRGETRIRFDPFCMRPICWHAETLVEAKQALENYSRRFSFDWERESMLIVDNWRCLHARGRDGDKAPSRKLRRWSIGANHGLDIRFPLQQGQALCKAGA